MRYLRPMRGKWLLWIRRVHLYLSVFFAPLLLLFVITGWAQTMDFDHSSALMEKLSQVHTSQYFPTSRTKAEETPEKTDSPKPDETSAPKEAPRLTWPMQWLISAMSIALILSISLGLVLAFSVVRNTAPVWISLALGIVVPVLLLAVAHF